MIPGRSKMPLRAAVSLPIILFASIIVTSQTPAGSKAEGVIRVGLALPRVTLIGASGSVPSEASSLRQLVSSYLTGPRIGTVDLKARLDSLALEEGQERQCDFVLYTSLTRKRQQTGTGAGGSFSSTKADEEITFEYKLVSGDGVQAAAANVANAKVKFDGEDILTPMIEGAAEAIVAIARKARPAPPAATAKTGDNPSVDVPQPRPTPTSTESNKAPTGYDLLVAGPPKTRTPPNVSDPPKAEGAIRIGIVTPRVSLVGGGGAGKESTAVSESVISYLGGSTIETINLRARLDSLALDEGKRRECDYVLYTALILKRQGSSSNSGGSLLGIIGPLGGSGIGNKIPGGKAAQGVSSGAASVGGHIASLARAKDEVTFEYKLVTSNGARPVVANITKAKVKSDGEDVLTPMIETAAQAIVDATKKN